MEIQQIHSREFVDVGYDVPNNWLYANWKGYQSDASVKEGCELILGALMQRKAERVMNDNRQVYGIWTGVAQWLAHDWVPRLRAAGLCRFAIIYSPRRLSQLSADTAIVLADPGKDVLAAFHTEEAAAVWLDMPAMRHAAAASGSVLAR